MSNREEFLKRIQQANKDLGDFTAIFEEWGTSICDTPKEEIKRQNREEIKSKCSEEFNQMMEEIQCKYQIGEYGKTVDKLNVEER